MDIGEYEKQQGRYADFAQTVATVLAAAIEHDGTFRLQVVRARAKDAQSLRNKLDDRQISDSKQIESDIKDLAGCRAIFYTNGDVERLIRSGLIEHNFKVLERKIHHPGIDPKSADRLYTAIHYLVELRDDRLALPEYARFAGMRCEIQVHTILNHAYAEIEHDVYKAPELPKDFGDAALKSVKKRLNDIAVKYLLPAGFEFDKATVDFNRLARGKELLDRKGLAAIGEASNNNERFDAIERFAKQVLPLYDEPESVWSEVLRALQVAAEQARRTEPIPIEYAPGAFLPGKTFTDVAQVIADSVRSYRYLDLPRALDVVRHLHQLGNNDGERAPSLELAHSIAKPDLEVWNLAGPWAQRMLIDYVSMLPVDALRVERSLWIPVLEDALDTEATSTRATSSTAIALGRGALTGSPELESVRGEALGLLRALFAMAETEGERERVIAVMAHAAHPPYGGAPTRALTAILMADAVAFMDFAATIVGSASLELARTLENRVHRMFKWYHTVRPDLADDPALRQLTAHVKASTARFRQALAAVADLAPYKILVGFDSTFDWDWKGETRSFDELDQFRKAEAAALLEAIHPDTFDEWFDRLERFAQTDSTDLATFPVFGQFLEDLARRFPERTLAHLSRITGRLEDFLPRLLKGLLQSGRATAALEQMRQWLARGEHLRQLGWLVVAKGDLAVAQIQAILDAAIANQDPVAVRHVVRGLAFHYEQFHDQPQQRQALLLQALIYLLANADHSWVRMGWFSWSYSQHILDALDLPTVQSMLEWFVPMTEFHDGAADFLAALFAPRPALLLDFLDRRMAVHERESDLGVVAVPYDLNDALRPLRAIPAQVLVMARRWFDANDHTLEYSAERVIRETYDEVTPQLHAELERLLRSGEREDALFALEILKAFESEPAVYELAKLAAALWGDDEEITQDIYNAISQEGGTSGVFGRAKAIQAQRDQLALWLDDERENVREFAQKHLPYFDQRTAEETQRAQAMLAARRLQFDEPPLDGPPEGEPPG
jgi:ppGpp synthetase/RelA/SpoT-type nucleotidyltranferase